MFLIAYQEFIFNKSSEQLNEPKSRTFVDKKNENCVK